MLVEVSAGNEGPGCYTLRSPGAYEQVLTTGSVNHGYTYPGLLTGFSSRGPSSAYPLAYFPDVMAPGQNVRSSIPGGDYQGGWSGTSMSGPHVTGLVGLIWSANPALRGQVALTMQIITSTAVPLTGQGGSSCGGDYVDGPNNDWGHGTIDALAAVQLALSLGGDVGYLHGTVTDATTALPVAGALVGAAGAGGSTADDLADAAGYYTLTLPVGIYTVTVGVFGYLPATVSGVDVITGLVTTQDFSLTALPAYVISGTVSDADTGAPLSATVRVLGTPLPPAQSDPVTGFYSVTVPSGTYTFLVELWGYEPLTRTVVADQDQTQNFELSPLPFVPYRGNPVLEAGPPGTWEAWWIGAPNIKPVGEVTYLFYDGIDSQASRKYAIGYATSTDGVSFTKSISNPIFAGDGSGFDAYNVLDAEVLVADGTWILYYSGAPFHDPQLDWYEIGRATALNPTGPWTRLDDPVLRRGSTGEWDAGKVFVDSVLATEEGYVLYYRAEVYDLAGPGMIGMAKSTDGLTWTKYDDPTTTDPPYAESDPVLYPGAPGEWDGDHVWSSCTRQTMAGWEMFYTGMEGEDYNWVCGIGYATSADGITWHKYAGNPVLEPQYAPWAELTLSYPSVVVSGTAYVLYYGRDGLPGGVGFATGGVCMPLAEVIFDWQPVEPTFGDAITLTAAAAGSDPVAFTWDTGDSFTATGRVITHTYAAAGTYTVTLTATNCEAGTASVMHTVTVVSPCEALEAVSVDGPVYLLTGEMGLYTATYTPPTATLPVTITWGNGTIGPTATYSWTSPGTYTITVTATNACSVVQGTFTVEVCQPVEAVAVAGPMTLWVGEAGRYTATAAPPTATLPVTYTWEFGLMGPTAIYSWTVPGTYTLTVTATNPCLVTVTGSYVVDVRAEYHIYLPLVRRP